MAFITASAVNGVEPETELEEDTLARLDAMWREASMHPVNMDWRIYAEKAFRYHRGEQLDAEMIAALRDRKQPEVIENLIRPQRKAFMRVYHKLRLRAAFTGRNQQMDEQTSAAFNDLNRYSDQQSGFFDEEALAVKEMWIAGQGWIEKQKVMDPDGLCRIDSRREDPFSMWADPYGRRRDLHDFRYLIRSKFVDVDQMMEEYPEKRHELQMCAGLQTGSSGNGIAEDPAWVNTNEQTFANADRHRMRTTEVWYRRRAQRKIAVSADGTRVPLTNMSTKEALRLMRGSQFQPEDVIVDQMWVGIYCGNVLLHHDLSPYWHGQFPFISYVYERDISGKPVGWITDDIMSVQDAINKRQSKALHLMSTKQVVYTENAVEDDNRLATEVARPDGMIKLNQVRNINDVFKMIPNTDMGVAQLQMYANNRQAFDAVGSSSEVGEGQAPGDVRSDRGLARLESNAVGLDAEVLNGIRASRRDGLLIQSSMIQQFFTDDMVFQITEDANAVKIVQVTKEQFQTLRRFLVDLALVEENDYATTRQQQLDMLMTSLPQFLSINPGWASVLISMTDLRDKEALLQQVQAMAAPQQPEPKVSLSLSWADMPLVDRVLWAKQLHMPDELIQLMVQNPSPSKTELLVQSDQAKQASKEKMEGERLDLKAAEVDNKNADREKDREFEALRTASQEVTKRLGLQAKSQPGENS